MISKLEFLGLSYDLYSSKLLKNTLILFLLFIWLNFAQDDRFLMTSDECSPIVKIFEISFLTIAS